jgi:DNA invertase Pin-like site-specific DNA recombinase
VSTGAQAAKDKISLVDQKKECRALAETHGFTIPGDLVFEDVQSGADPTRQGLLHMKAAARAGRFTRLYIWAQDRLTREGMKQALDELEELERAGVAVYSIQEGALTDELLSGIRGWMAGQERKRIVARTLPKKLAKRDRGLWVVGKTPFGYRLRSDQLLEKCPYEAQIVRQIFADCLAGLGRVAIARRLNDANALPLEAKVRIDARTIRRLRPGNLVGDQHDPSAFRRWCEQHGAEFIGPMEWSARSVSHVLGNSASYGVLLSEAKTPIVLQINGSPIVTKGEFEAAQRALKARIRAGRRPARPWLLVGLIECSSCGMSYMHHEGRNHRYRCRSRRDGGKCSSPGVRMGVADRAAILAVRDFLSGHLGSDAQVAHFLANEARDDRERLRARRDELEAARVIAQSEWEARQQDFAYALRSGVRGSSIPLIGKSVEDAKTKLDEIVAEISATQDALTASESGLTATAAELRAVVARVERASWVVVGKDQEPTTDVFSVIRALVEKVIVHPDRTVTVRLNEKPSAILATLSRITTSAVLDERQDMGRAVARSR